MNEEIFKLNNLCFSNNNEILVGIINQINEIINDLLQKKQIDIIIKQLKNIIIIANQIITDNKKNFQQIIEEIKKMNNNINIQFNDLKNNNNNNIITKIYKDGGDYDGKYIGEFKDGLRHGKGIMIFDYGDRYEGDWKNDKREGKGIFYFKDDSRYEGDYKNNKRNGIGVLYFVDGDRYEGGFKNGNLDGKGIFYFKNGDREMGDYLNGEPIGKHVILHSDGIVTTQIH